MSSDLQDLGHYSSGPGQRAQPGDSQGHSRNIYLLGLAPGISAAVVWQSATHMAQRKEQCTAGSGLQDGAA